MENNPHFKKYLQFFLIINIILINYKNNWFFFLKKCLNIKKIEDILSLYKIYLNLILNGQQTCRPPRWVILAAA